MQETINIPELSDADKRIIEAALSSAFPVNSLPFLAAVRDRLAAYGTNSLLGEELKDDPVITAAFIVLTQQFKGQIRGYDPVEEYGKLVSLGQRLGLVDAAGDYVGGA